MSLERLGLQLPSLVDFPGVVAATVFTFGCNLRCPYCHNPALVVGPRPDDFLEREEVGLRILARKRMLGGIVVTGGEPCVHEDLPGLLRQLDDIGLPLKLDTNGLMPEALKRALSAAPVSMVAIDLKTDSQGYRSSLGWRGTRDALELIAESIAAVRERQGTRLQLRTTDVPELLDDTILSKLNALVPADAAWTRQPYRPENTLRDWLAAKGLEPLTERI